MKRDGVLFLILGFALALVSYTPQLLDFAAFSCAGRAVAQHQSPYDHVGVLAACEQQVVAVTGALLTPGEILPAPFPPYTLAIFSLFALLPPAFGAVLWLALLLTSYIAIVMMLKRMSGLPFVLITAVTLVPIAWASIEVAQVTPVILAFIVGAAFASQAERPFLAAALAVASMCEPHLGLPVCLALFCTQGATRLPLIGGGIVLAAVSFLTMSPSLAFHYVGDILPRHAHAEMLADAQMSLSHALAVLGLPENAALALGSLQYLAMVLFGTVLAVRIVHVTQERDLAILSAPALAMIGGSFVHIHQIAVASCCALLLARGRATKTYALDVSFMLAATPLIIARSPSQMFLYIAIVTVIAIVRGYSRIAVAGFAVAMGVMVQAAYMLMGMRLPLLMPLEEVKFIPHYNYGFDADIETVWHAFVAARYSWLGPVSLIVQVPAFIALGIVCAALVRLQKGIAHAGHVRSSITTFGDLRD